MKKINLTIAKEYLDYIQGIVEVGRASKIYLESVLVKGELGSYSKTGWFLTVIAEETINGMKLEYDNPEDNCYIDANGTVLFVYPSELAAELDGYNLSYSAAGEVLME